MDPRVKRLRIQSGVVRRLAKELQVYSREAEQQRAKLEAARAAGKEDEYELKKRDEVLREALMMVPDCERRLAKAQGELRAQLEADAADLAGAAEYAEAERVLRESEEPAAAAASASNQ